LIDSLVDAPSQVFNERTIKARADLADSKCLVDDHRRSLLVFVKNAWSP
jgi:hypothetical protein